MFMCDTVCYFTGILYAVVSLISMLFIDNNISVFCILQGFEPTLVFLHSQILCILQKTF